MNAIRRQNATIDWSKIAGKSELSDEERRIVELLAARKSLPAIGKELGQHRSMIWRKIERIKARLSPSSDSRPGFSRGDVK